MDISKDNSSAPNAKPQCIGFEFHKPDVNFTGRWTELDRIKQYNRTEKTTKVILVSGLGGIGKTQLVRKFIDENKDFYENVIWINAEKRETINEDFQKLAKIMEITTSDNGKEIDSDSVIKKVIDKLCVSQTLIVFDNADNVDKTENIILVLTKGTLNIEPHFVITSRIQEWDDGSFCHIKLDVFNPEDAVKYVSTAMKDQEHASPDETELTELTELLQRFPLALTQATAYIRNMRITEKFSIADYCQLFKSSKKEILDSKQRHFLHQYAETTFTTWRVTIDKINKCKADGELALTILRIISYFDPVHIRRDIFFNLEVSLDTKTSELHVKSAVRLLVNYSMLESWDHQSVLSIHRLVQEVMKIHLESVTDISKATLWNGLRLISKMKETENFKDCHEHGISVFISVLALQFFELIHEFKSLPADILQGLIECNRFLRAKSFGENILNPLEKCLGGDAPEILITKSAVAASYRSLGKHNDAIGMYHEVLEKQKLILSEEHPDTLTTKSNIAYSLDEMGKHSEAERIYEEVLKGVEIIFGENHEKTLSTKSNIATVYIALGKHSEAIRMYEDVIEGMRLTLGESGDDHPVTLTTKSNIAYLYSAEGKYSEALDMYEDIFKKQSAILGEDHLDTLNRKFNIACLYDELGKYPEALQIHNEVFEKRKKILGENHLETLATKSSIASTYRAMGRNSEALQMHEEVFEELKQILGEDHSKTLDSKLNVAFLKGVLEENSVALQMYQEIFKKQMEILRENHPDTLLTLFNIALTHCKMGNHSEAIKIFQEVLDKQRVILSEDHPHTLTTASNIASTYRTLGKHSEALEIYVEVFKKLATLLGENHPKTISTKFNIAITHSALRQYSEALQLFEKQIVDLGEDHPFTFRLKYNVALTHSRMDNHFEAIAMYQQILEKQTNDLGETHPDTLDTKSNIASAYRALGKHSESLKILEEVFVKQRDALGETHPDTLITKSNIEISHCALKKQSQVRAGLAVLSTGVIAAAAFKFFR